MTAEAKGDDGVFIAGAEPEPDEAEEEAPKPGALPLPDKLAAEEGKAAMGGIEASVLGGAITAATGVDAGGATNAATGEVEGSKGAALAIRIPVGEGTGEDNTILLIADHRPSQCVASL